MNANLELTSITLPAAWASALINGDFSGLEEPEAARCKARVAELARDGWTIVDVARDDDGEGQEPRFTRSYRFYDPDATCTGGDVLDYVLMRGE